MPGEIAARCATWGLNSSPRVSIAMTLSSTKNSIWKSSEHLPSQGAGPMLEKPPDNQQQLWIQILGGVQEKVPTHAFETWFPPVIFNGISDDTLMLTVPNEAFRQALSENYADLLESILAQFFPN